MNLSIQPASTDDAAQLCAIYDHYVTHTHVSFETEPLGTEDMAARMDKVASQELPWLVAHDENGHAIGYTYATQWKARHAYRFTAESTVYIAPDHIGRGVGRRLYAAMLAALHESAAHSVIGVIALPNDASIRLHEHMGFRKAAHFTQVGYKFDRWVDVGYWQLML